MKSPILTTLVGLLLATTLGAADTLAPIAPDFSAYDTDGDRIRDDLFLEASEFANDAASRLPVILVLAGAPGPADSALIESLGGTILNEYHHALNGFAVDIPAAALGALRDGLGARLVGVTRVYATEATLDDTLYQARIRQAAWGGGYRGNSNTTVLVLDSGFDDSHADLAGRVVSGCWADFSASGLASPRDFYSHGTLVASIAVGDGSAYGTTLTPTITTVSDGWHPGDGATSYYSFHKIMNPGATTLTFNFAAGATATFGLSDFNWQTVASGSGPTGSILTHTPALGGFYNSYLSIWNNNNWSPYRVRAVHPVSGGPYPFDGQNYLSGAAPEAMLGGVKILNDDGSGNSAMMIAGLNWAVANRDTYNIRIINMSVALLGGTTDPAVNTAVQNCANNGILVVCTAANDFPNLTIPSPGISPYALTVGAVNDAQEMANYSSNGALGSNKPDVVAPGGSIVRGSMVTGADSNDGDAFGNFPQAQMNIHRNGYGTSMAAPHVAGLAAILIDVQETNGNPWQPTLARVMELKGLICMTATETNQPGEMQWNFGSMPTTPSGNDPTLDRGGKDVVEGYGQINADAPALASWFPFSIPTQNPLPIEFGYFPWERRCWAMRLPTIVPGTTYTINGFPYGGPLTDCDIYLYETTPTATGQPVIFLSSTNVGLTENITFTADASTPPLYIVVKKVGANGTGTFGLDIQTSSGGTNFRRGDVNSDDLQNIADAVALLGFLFSGGAALACDEAGDVNDDGNLDIADAVSLLGYLFSGAAAPPNPFINCGPDTDGDNVNCTNPTGSC